MSNNERLTELVGYANNAAGASNQQYEKTLESLEAKINNLNNAMDIFWTNLANSDVIKGAIDLLTKFLNAINATKLIGITLSEGGIMIPEKSVSAIMGLSKIDTKCHLEGCEACGNAECQYRR